MINRFIVKSISETLKHFPVVLLTGPRQIGKSTIVYSQFVNKGYSYVSLDDPLELNVAQINPRGFLQSHPYPLIIDEAQKAPQLFVEIERIVNKSRLEVGNKESNGMYILSGSNRKQLLAESQESLSGRVAILDMSNLSLNEILNKDNNPFAINYENSNVRSNRYYVSETEAFKYIVRGFFPALYDDLGINTQTYYSSYITTYLEKDLKEILNITNQQKFISFLRILASNTGQELIYENYAKQVGVVLNTIKVWVDSLVKTGIIYLVESYNEESVVKRIVKRPKLYFFDTGLACYLCGIDSAYTLQNSFLNGRFFETFVVNEIRKTYLNAGLIQNLYYYRDSDQNEIDLILINDGKLSCIEIKSGHSANVSMIKSFKKLNETKLLHGTNAVICTSDKVSYLNENTLVLPIAAI